MKRTENKAEVLKVGGIGQENDIALLRSMPSMHCNCTAALQLGLEKYISRVCLGGMY
jgi:hypothetical protein